MVIRKNGKRTAVILSGALLSVMACVAVSGCTKKESAPTTNAPTTATSPGASTDQQIAQGSHSALQFDYKMTSELLIAKSDPRTGDHWMGRFRRNGLPSADNENDWNIELGPDEMTYGDRKAFGSFLLHLLDTIRTLQVKEAPVSGTQESFGLEPPLFTLRWQVSEPRAGSSAPSAPNTIQARVFKQYEIRLGSPVKGADGTFQGLYASFGGLPGKTFIVQGATLEMLDKITNFQALRLPTLATMTSDDVDELAIKRVMGKPGAFKKTDIYAQRDGDHWTDAQHKPLKADINAFLDQVTHLRILRFIDDPAEQKKIEKEFNRADAQTITFKDRKGTSQTMQLVEATPGSPKVFATFSTRLRKTLEGKQAPALFEVYPEVMGELRKL